MDNLMVRCGILAALRSATLQGQIVGLMITASHNPVEVQSIQLFLVIFINFFSSG